MLRFTPILLTAATLAQSPFATHVLDYRPMPGQFVANPAFNDPTRALGAPIGGGTFSADNTKVVTLGGFGGSITLGFDHPVLNRPPTATNPFALDLIVFGNAFWANNVSATRLAEPGVIEVSRDDNGNGLADDPWYVIPGSFMSSPPINALHTKSYAVASMPSWWIPPSTTAGPPETYVVTAYQLQSPFLTGASPILYNPLAAPNAQFGIGHADCNPTLELGDLDADGTADAPEQSPDFFFTVPTSPQFQTIDRFSGGGDAIDLSQAVAPDGTPANLASIDFVRITTGVDIVRPVFGECSTEVSAVAEVRPRKRADLGSQGGLLGADGQLDNNDFVVFINQFFQQHWTADVGHQGGLSGAGGIGDGQFDNNDFVVFINWFFQGE